MTVNTYAWERCETDGSGCVALPETTRVRTNVTADVGKRLKGKAWADGVFQGERLSSIIQPIGGGGGGGGGDIFFDFNPALGSLQPWTNVDLGAGSILVNNLPFGGDSPGQVRIYDHPTFGKLARETVTPTAHASPAASTDSVYLWNPQVAGLFVPGQTTWLHYECLFPSLASPYPYRPQAATEQTPAMIEFHNDNTTSPFAPSSVVVSVFTDSFGGQSGDRLDMRVRGGLASNDGSYRDPATYTDGPGCAYVPLINPIVRDRVYDVWIGVTWSTTPGSGHITAIVDGVTKYDQDVATLTITAGGHVDHPNLDANNYRPHDTVNSTVMYRRLRLASTQAAAAFDAASSFTPTADAFIVEKFTSYALGTTRTADGTLGPWNVEISAPQGGVPAGSITVAEYLGKRCAKLHAGAQTFDDNAGTLQSLWLPNNSLYSGEFLGGIEGQVAYFRWKHCFPVGTRFTTGEWNRHVAWHNDNVSAATALAFSTGFDVYTDYPVAPTTGLNPKQVLRVYGGQLPGFTETETEFDAIVFDHWYDNLVKLTWGSTALNGRFEWYQDDLTTPKYSASVPTLYKHADGSLDHPAFGIYLYRLMVPWTTDYYFADIAVGPTRASVGA